MKKNDSEETKPRYFLVVHEIPKTQEGPGVQHQYRIQTDNQPLTIDRINDHLMFDDWKVIPARKDEVTIQEVDANFWSKIRGFER